MFAAKPAPKSMPPLLMGLAFYLLRAIKLDEQCNIEVL